ncbi:MAG: tetratricopeptide repeat protein [Gammaproteobacteria bacterium]|jgi:TolB-like protein/Flp pilus assembly protein TadD|nr:tetratricopeptide repeat protein [Gammaproteobacteria bacterium]
MTSFFSELQRRNVFRVTAAYAIVGWLIAQIADLGLESFGAPDWVMKTLLLLLIIGLPVAIVLSWAFEMTSEGVRRETDAADALPVVPKSGRKLDLIIIACLAIALAYFVYESREDAGAGSRIVVDKSIAVLPFINIGGNTEDDYLSDGLAETLLHLLAQVEEIQVAARTSAFKFKNTNEDVRIIGEQLGVATVLEGSIQRSGEKIRITAQLINVDDGFHLWSANFDRTINDIFVVQDEIAKSVVAALQVTLLGDVQYSEGLDPAAYDRLLRLRNDVRSGSNARLATAIDSLEALTEEYPTYVDAYAELATAYISHATRGGLIPEQFTAKALRAAEEAVRLGPDVATGHIALANVLTGRGEFLQAAPIIARALELEPGNADLMVDKAAVLAARKDFNQAVALLARANRLDPLNAATKVALSNSYANTGQVDKAISILQAALALSPDNVELLYGLSAVNQSNGNYDDAITQLKRLGELAPDHIGAWQDPFIIYMHLGELDLAEDFLLGTEALSLNRAADERALYCYVIDDKECQYTATQRLIATREGFFVQLWQARMLLDKGMRAEAIVVMESLDRRYEETGAVYGNLQSRVNLGALYHLAGDVENRDRVLGRVRESIQHGFENGWSSWIPYYYLAAADAAAGDLQSSISLLDQAREKGFRANSYFDYDFLWDPYRSDPDFQAVRSITEPANPQ